MDKASNKSKMISTCSNNVFAEIYNTIICKIYILLYNIKLSTKLLKAFCCRQNRIYRNDISKAKCLPFSQVETLPFRALKKQLHICAKLVKSRNTIAISKIMRLSLTR